MVLVLLVLGLDFQHKINIGTSELFLCTGPLRGKENKHMRGEGGVFLSKEAAGHLLQDLLCTEACTNC